MIVACLALTIALSGAGYAAVVLPRNSVGTKQLKRDAVTAKIKNGNVTGVKIADNAITSELVGLDLLQDVDLAPSIVGNSELKANSVQGSAFNIGSTA